jgi:hypothetical protein
MRPQIQMLEYGALTELGACTVMAIGVWQPKIRSASPAPSVTTARPPIRLLKFANQENSKLRLAKLRVILALRVLTRCSALKSATPVLRATIACHHQEYPENVHLDLCQLVVRLNVRHAKMDITVQLESVYL